MAAQALGFRSTGRGDPLDSRPGPSGVGVAGSAWGYACGVGDDEVGFAASTNSGDKRRRGVHADSRQGRRWHRSRVARSVEVVSGCTGRRRCGRTSRRGVSREQGLLLRQLPGPPWWSSCCSSSSECLGHGLSHAQQVVVGPFARGTASCVVSATATASGSISCLCLPPPCPRPCLCLCCC